MQTTDTGLGELLGAGGDIWLPDAQYELTIDHARIAGGLPAIHGAILNAPPHGFAAWMIGSEAVLRLADGREWSCTLADGAGTLHPRGEEFRRGPFDAE
jgi:hypothetical protein